MPRTKGAPKRDAHALVQVSKRSVAVEDLSDDEWIPPSTKAIIGDHGGVGEEEEEKVGGVKKQEKPQQQKRDKSTLSKTIMTYKDTGETFDPESIAAQYMEAAGGGGGGMAQLGLAMHNQLLTSARLAAADSGGSAVSVDMLESPGKRTTMAVEYRLNKKLYMDKVPHYETQEVAAVLTAVLRRQSTKRRKATTTHPSVKVEEVAKRSPPLFWSIFWNFQADVHRGLGAVLGMAESLMATGEEGEG